MPFKPFFSAQNDFQTLKLSSNRFWCVIIACGGVFYGKFVTTAREVLAKLKKISETCEGLKNEENSRRVNDLNPMFDSKAITHLYMKIFVEKPELLKELAEVDTQIAEMQTSQVKLTANFDYRPLLKKFDAAAINKSVIKY